MLGVKVWRSMFGKEHANGDAEEAGDDGHVGEHARLIWNPRTILPRYLVKRGGLKQCRREGAVGSCYLKR